jgi:hypothetical protein
MSIVTSLNGRNIGPVTSVVLDTTYCDRLVRIDRGCTSGTCFLFASTIADEVSDMLH